MAYWLKSSQIAESDSKILHVKMAESDHSIEELLRDALAVLARNAKESKASYKLYNELLSFALSKDDADGVFSKKVPIVDGRSQKKKPYSQKKEKLSFSYAGFVFNKGDRVEVRMDKKFERDYGTIIRITDARVRIRMDDDGEEVLRAFKNVRHAYPKYRAYNSAM